MTRLYAGSVIGLSMEVSVSQENFKRVQSLKMHYKGGYAEAPSSGMCRRVVRWNSTDFIDSKQKLPLHVILYRLFFVPDDGVEMSLDLTVYATLYSWDRDLEIWGFHGGEDSCYGYLGYETVLTGIFLPRRRRQCILLKRWDIHTYTYLPHWTVS
jgi:hypothetical protein